MSITRFVRKPSSASWLGTLTIRSRGDQHLLLLKGVSPQSGPIGAPPTDIFVSVNDVGVGSGTRPARRRGERWGRGPRWHVISRRHRASRKAFRNAGRRLHQLIIISCDRITRSRTGLSAVMTADNETGLSKKWVFAPFLIFNYFRNSRLTL